MEFTLAEQYYLKAIDDYPYNLEFAIENLNYALGYDREHAGANCLMGQVFMEQMSDYARAEEYFIEALTNDPGHLKTLECYARLAVWVEEYTKADRLIRHAFTVKGCDRAVLYELKAYCLEAQQKYDEALAVLEQSLEMSFNDEFTGRVEREIERVEKKRDRAQRKGKPFVYRMDD